jgi:O-antigen/teichoic acid export membrane protein
MFATSIKQFHAMLRHRALIALFDQGAVSVASFGTGILLSRAFAGEQREQLGLYYLASTIGILIVEIQNALVSTPHTVKAPTISAEQLSQFNGSALIQHAGLSILITVLLAFFAAMAPYCGLANHQPMLIACAATAAMLGLRNFARFLNFALHRPHVSCLADWLVTILQIGGTVLLTHSRWLSAWSAVVVIGVASFAGGTTAILLTIKQLRPRLRSAWVDFRASWNKTRWIFASGTVWNVGTNFYGWFIDRVGNILQTAVWGNCNSISSYCNPVLIGLQNWMGPAVAHAYTDRSRREFRKYVLRCALLFVALIPPTVGVLALISEPLLQHLYHDFTEGTTIIVLLMAISWLVQSSSFVISRGLFSLGRGDLDLWANIIPILVLIGGGYFLVRHYGVAGAAWSLLIAQLLATLARAVLFWQVAVLPARDKQSVQRDSAVDVFEPVEAI